MVRGSGLGAVRLLLLPTCSSLHGRVAQGSMQKRVGEGMGSGALAVGAPWDTQGCGQGEGHQRALGGCRMPKPHSGRQEGTHVSQRGEK